MAFQFEKADYEIDRKGTPEENLIAACLARAIQDVYDDNMARNSRSWFFDDSTEPFSFIWCMQSLNIEHLIDKIRDMIDNEADFLMDSRGHHKDKQVIKQRSHWYINENGVIVKECSYCHKVLPRTEYNKKNELYWYSYCKECKIKMRESRRATSLYGKRQSCQQGQPLPL